MLLETKSEDATPATPVEIGPRDIHKPHEIQSGLFPTPGSLYIGKERFTMGDPQNYGLSELGQRVQAMGDPAPEPRLRPYQGGTLPGGATANGAGTRPSASSSESSPWENERPLAPAAAGSSPYAPYPGSYATPITPASPEPYPPLGPAATSFNGALNGTIHGTSPSSVAYGATTPLNSSPGSSPSPQAALPPPADPNAPKSGLQRAVDAVRSAIPLVQRLLPLLDGNFATAVTALVAPQLGHHHPPPPPAVQQVHQAHQVHIDLEPVERGLAEVRTSHRELRSQVVEQGTTLKRVEDQLERVREATDRNTLEQQELVEDLRAVGGRISTFAIIGLVLLAVSLGLNIYFLVQLQHILR
jgi:hypothetical protein